MPIQLQDGTLRVMSSYSLKTDSGEEYGSHSHSSSLSIEFDLSDMSADDVDAVIKFAESIEPQLAVSAKLAVFTQLGVEFAEGPSGVLLPKVGKPKASAPKKTYARKGGGGGGAKAAERKPAANTDDLPRVTLTWKGDDVDFIDLRPLKESGRFSPKAADFRQDGVPAREATQLWITDKDGSVNDDVAAALEEAGVDF